MKNIHQKILFLLIIINIFCLNIFVFGSSFRPRTVAEERAKAFAKKANPSVIYQPRIQTKKNENTDNDEPVSPDSLSNNEIVNNNIPEVDNSQLPPLEVFELWLKDSLKISFGENNYLYNKNASEKTYVIKTWFPGLASRILTYFSVGNIQNPLLNINEVSSAFSNTVYDYLFRLGITDWNVVLNVVSDVNHTDIFLSYKDGKTVYNIINK